jgi:hypothetical protein
MTRAVSVGRSFNGLWAAGALGLAFLTIPWAGCAGSLDPMAFTGGAGSTGTAGNGAAGTGAAGTSGGNCDMVKLITAAAPMGYSCTLASACHDSAGSAAGLSLMQADWPKLAGTTPMVKTPPPNFPSVCATDATTKTIPYIKKGSATGDGLLLQKLMGSPCAGGVQMPSLGSHVSPTDMMCFVQWATMLAAAP